MGRERKEAVEGEGMRHSSTFFSPLRALTYCNRCNINIESNIKTSRRYRTWTIVNNIFCWLLGMVAKVKNRRHCVK